MLFPRKLTLSRAALEIANGTRRRLTKTLCTSASHNVVYKYYDNLINLEFGRKSDNCNKWDKVSSCNHFRALSTKEIKVKPTVANTPIATSEESQEFTAIFSDIVKDLTHSKMYTDIPEVTERLAEVLEYTVPKGEHFSGKITVKTYKMLEKPDNLTATNIKLANILGWCAELLMNYYVVTDDIIDHAEIRRGKLCWHRKPEIGLQAISDATMIYAGAFELLKMHFSCLPCYIPLLELFHKSTMKTAIGQTFDAFCRQNNKIKLDVFTMDRYQKITECKSYCTYCLLVGFGMYLANIFDEELHRQVKTILLKMGSYTQLEDDFIDAFNSYEFIEKYGTNIQNGDCTWLIIYALGRATPNQRAIIEEHYGKSENISVQAIRNLYEDLNLPSVFLKYREERYNEICTLIKQLPGEFSHDLMFGIVNHIFNRKF